MADSSTILEDQGLRLFQLYALFGNPTDKWDMENPEYQGVLGEHVAWLRGLEASGQMFAGGPLRAPDYEWDGSGLMFHRCDSLKDATALSEQDPLVAAGLRTYEVKGWQLNEGRLNFSIDLDSSRVSIS